MQKLVTLLALYSLAIPVSAVEVSRSKVDHPALGTTGGASLHSAIEAIYVKLGDNANSRYQEYSGIGNGVTVELDHNFGVNETELNVLIYSGSGTSLTRIPDPESQSPPWTIQEKTGSEKTVIEVITPSSGTPDPFTVIAIHGKGSEKLNDLSDVDVTTATPEDGQALVFSVSAGNEWIPGASGDASFKIQSIADPNGTIKGGKYALTNRRQLATYDGAGSDRSDFLGDLTCDLDTILGSSPTNNTTYTLVVDLNSVGNVPINTTEGDELYPVECTDFALLTTYPEGSLGSRYVPVGEIHSADSGTVWSGTGASFSTHAFRLHDQTYVTVSPIIYSLAEQAIGSIGSSGQVVGGHALTSGSFSSTPAALSWWTLDDDFNDDSANGRNLTANGGISVNGTGLFGVSNTSVDCDGSDDEATSTDSALIIQSGGTSFTAFLWANPDAFDNGNAINSGEGVIAAEPNGFGWGLQFAASSVLFNLSEDGTDLDFRPFISHTDSGISTGEWHHWGLVYDSSNQVAKIYLDGTEVASLATTGLTLAETTTFRVCGDGDIDQFNGKVAQVGFEKRVFTAEEIRKLASYRIDHNQNVAIADQNWVATFSGGLANQLDNGWIVDKSTDSLWFDFFDLDSTDSVALKLKNENASAHVIPLNNFDTGFLSSAPSFPLSHGLGSVPTQVEVIHEGQTTAGDYDDVRDKCSWDDTSITCTGLNVIDGTHRLRIVMSTSTVAVAVAEATATDSGIVTTGSQTFAGNKTFTGSNNLFNKSTSSTGMGGGIEVDNNDGTYSSFQVDNGGRGVRIHTSDYDNTTTGSALQFSLGGETGDVNSKIIAQDQGGSAQNDLELRSEFTLLQGDLSVEKLTKENWSSTRTVVQMGGNAAIFTPETEAAGNTIDYLMNSYNDGAQWLYTSTDEAVRYRQDNGNHRMYSAVSGTADTAITWTERFNVLEDGTAQFQSKVGNDSIVKIRSQNGADNSHLQLIDSAGALRLELKIDPGDDAQNYLNIKSDAGANKVFIVADGESYLGGGETQIEVPEDGDCNSNAADANVCSGTYNPVEDTFTNLEGTNPSIGTTAFSRVGKVITMSFRLDNWNPDGGGNPSMEIDVPVGPFTTLQSGGTCTDTLGNVIGIRGISTTKLQIIRFDSTNEVNSTAYCNVVYGL